MMYFIGQSRSCRPKGSVICGTFSHCAILLVSSCSAPNGQSQPQKGPRPQNSRPAATAAHRMKTSGAERKNSHLKSVISELVNVRTLTTESCALAYQPSQTSVKSRKPRLTQPKSFGRRTSQAWKKKIAVSTSSPTTVMAISTVFIFHIRIQSGSSSGSSASAAAASAWGCAADDSAGISCPCADGPGADRGSAAALIVTYRSGRE